MKKSLGFVYLAVILGIPFLTLNGWMILLLAVVLPAAALLSIIVLVKYYKNIEQVSPSWLLSLMATYATSFMLIRDGGDGDSWQGIEILFSKITGIQDGNYPAQFIPDSLEIPLYNLGQIAFLMFVFLSIAFLVKNFKNPEKTSNYEIVLKSIGWFAVLFVLVMAGTSMLLG